MSDIITKIILFIGLIIILVPFTYLWHFFIEHLPQKYGYGKFSLIVVCYLSIMALSTFLISEGMLGLIIFFTIPIIMLLIGAWFFKDEIKQELKWELKGLVSSNEQSQHRQSE